MERRPRLVVAAIAAFVLCLLACSALPVRAQAGAFHIDEATIASVHAAMKAKTLRCRVLVEAYLQRIDEYDKQGPALNAIVLMNPKALTEADALDAKFKTSGLTGPTRPPSVRHPG